MTAGSRIIPVKFHESVASIFFEIFHPKSEPLRSLRPSTDHSVSTNTSNHFGKMPEMFYDPDMNIKTLKCTI